MKDKQIIIDGVDITKCEFCDYENYEYPMCEQKRKRNELSIKCELRQNCHYKQKEKYKNALKEIREMLQIIMETNKVYPLQTNLDKILQKINEVLNAKIRIYKKTIIKI